MVGKTEAQLTRAGVSYEVGLADYREVRSGAGVIPTRNERPSGSPVTKQRAVRFLPRPLRSGGCCAICTTVDRGKRGVAEGVLARVRAYGYPERCWW